MDFNYDPQTLAKALAQDATLIENAQVQQRLHEASDTLEFLVKLLAECKHYIEDTHEYKAPPAFLKVLDQLLKK
jgi:hypothetical protein